MDDKRKSGIPLIGDLPWGSHFCQFYQTAEDLLDILLPYLEAGVEGNEFCIWITSGTAGDNNAGQVLEKAAHRLETSSAKGKVEIIPYSQWHAIDEKPGHTVSSMLDRAITGGYDGLRIAYTAFPEKERSQTFAHEIDTIRKYNALALFAYPRDEFDALGLMDVIKNHLFALVRNANGWEVIESSEARILKDELRRSEELYRSLFENMLNGFAYCRMLFEGNRPADFIYLAVNTSFTKLTGLKDVVGKRVTEVIPGIRESDPALFDIYGRVAMSGVPEQFETYLKTLDMWFSISVYSPAKGHFVAVFDVITERKKAEEKIAKLNEELRRNIAELSAANASMRESRRAALNMMEDSVAARRDTEKANIDLKRSVDRFELLAATAEELLQSQDPQRSVESLCKKVMSYLDCDVFFNFLIDEQEGRLHLNACAGIPEEEIRRIEWLDFGTAVCGCVARDGERIIAEHIPRTHDERTELLKSFGITAYCCHPLLGPGGKVIGTLSFGSCGRETFSEDDISLMKAVTGQAAAAMARKKSEQEILKLSEDMAGRNLELESANKEMESFIYSISHDLRAPIRTMSGFAKIIVEDYIDKLDEQGRDYLCRIQSGSERATHLIDDLLRLARISRQDMDLVTVDLSRKAESIIAGLRETTPGRNVDVAIAAGLTALADPVLAEVVLSNLLGNAWKFTSKTENARIEFGSADNDGETVFFVKDNGAGFDPAYAERIFLPFQRLHSAKDFEGTGIGLTIVERVVRRHGGRIWVEGEVGKGATFYFTLG
ncbi:MAG TPA: ATP-binding protein [Nitrospirota bacterium]|nr:ATP-binding protein [Nitrospirota bacterium]